MKNNVITVRFAFAAAFGLMPEYSQAMELDPRLDYQQVGKELPCQPLASNNDHKIIFHYQQAGAEFAHNFFLDQGIQLIEIGMFSKDIQDVDFASELGLPAYRRAAEGGNIHAQRGLGLFFEDAMNYHPKWRDLDQAELYLKLAAYHEKTTYSDNLHLSYFYYYRLRYKNYLEAAQYYYQRGTSMWLGDGRSM